MPRKHLVAHQTNQKQQYQAKIWQKLAKEIKAAAKVGGPNPEANSRLRAAIDKALDNNLSRESIEKNISGANKDNEILEQCMFECYGFNGMQIIIQALTSNVNRTISSLNKYLSKINGSIAKTNSVKVFFDQLGYFAISKSDKYNYDKILELTLDCNINDLVEFDNGYELTCNPNSFYSVKNTLLKNGVVIIDSEIKYIAQNKLTNIDSSKIHYINEFIELCQNDDDIQWVVTNYEQEE